MVKHSVLIHELKKLTNSPYRFYSVRILQLFFNKALNEFYNKTEIFSTQSKCSHNFRLSLAKESFHFDLFHIAYTFGSEQAVALYFNHFETVNVMVNVMCIQYVFHSILQLTFETYFVLVYINQ
jgi:hypothetical protein